MLNECSECGGNGYLLEDCPYCLGTGTLENGSHCDECSGTGEEEHVCEACDGTGEAEDEEDDEAFEFACQCIGDGAAMGLFVVQRNKQICLHGRAFQSSSQRNSQLLKLYASAANDVSSPKSNVVQQHLKKDMIARFIDFHYRQHLKSTITSNSIQRSFWKKKNMLQKGSHKLQDTSMKEYAFPM